MASRRRPITRRSASSPRVIRGSVAWGLATTVGARRLTTLDRDLVERHPAPVLTLSGEPVTVVIASPLEARLAERIAAAEPERTRVVYEPDLLPIARYAGDHDGIPPDLSRSDVDRWQGLLRRADVLFDFDWRDPASLPTSAPRVRWVQATVSGVGDYLARTGLLDWPVTVTTAAGIHGVPLSEFVVLGLLYFVKQVPDLLRSQRARRWERYTAVTLAGKRVVLIGLGRVGSQVARYLSESGRRGHWHGSLPEG